MKIYEYIREENERIIKIFGLTFMRQTSDYMTTERYQEFLGGLVTTKKVNDIYTDLSKKEIKVLGKSIIKRIEEDNACNYFLFNKKVFSISLINEFKKQYFKYFDKKHDDIYILKANSGETYLTLTYIINALIRKNNSKAPLLVATYEYHADMIKMICPDIPYVYIKNFRTKIEDDSFKIDNFRFFLLYSHVHFKQVEVGIKSHKIGEYHYFQSILDRLNLTEDDIEMNKIIVPDEVEKSMLEKVNKTGLNLNNFVFLAPEAQSCKLYDEDFWIQLINKFHEKGCDVYVNLTGNEVKIRNAADFKTCNLTFSQAFALARKAKKIVSLRSGFTEFLLQTGVTIDVLYTKFRRRHFFDDMDIYQVMSGFGLMKIPFSDKCKIREFNTYETAQLNCLNEALT